MRLVESHHDLIPLFEHDLRANAFRVCREGKPVSTFPDHALNAAHNRHASYWKAALSGRRRCRDKKVSTRDRERATKSPSNFVGVLLGRRFGICVRSSLHCHSPFAFTIAPPWSAAQPPLRHGFFRAMARRAVGSVAPFDFAITHFGSIGHDGRRFQKFAAMDRAPRRDRMCIGSVCLFAGLGT
jgi:hypothetical protein